jgi:hypothetical protein
MEKKFLHFINKNKYLIILFLLIPQFFILAYSYSIKDINKNCLYQAKVHLNIKGNPALDNFIENLVKQQSINNLFQYNPIQYPIIFFEGKNLECQNKINIAKKDIQLLSDDIVSIFLENSFANDHDHQTTMRLDPNFIKYFKAITKTNFKIVEIIDIKEINTYLKKSFISSAGLFIFSTLLIFLIFFFKIYLRKK